MQGPVLCLLWLAGFGTYLPASFYLHSKYHVRIEMKGFTDWTFAWFGIALIAGLGLWVMHNKVSKQEAVASGWRWREK